MNLPAMPALVAEVFARFSPEARRRLLELRTLILETAGTHPEVGPLTETLKWGEPAYLTEETRSGSTVRLGWKSTTPAKVYLYFHCRTNLVESFRILWSEDLAFEGNRAVVLRCNDALPRAPLQACIEAALTYHLERKHR
jgi:hypothetical protein